MQSASAAGAFGAAFPESCPDGYGTVGTDDTALAQVLGAEIPEVEWPLQSTKKADDVFYAPAEPFAPPTLVVLDFLEFCHRNIAKPIQGSFHSFFRHYHLSFDAEAGQSEFRTSINRIFSRNCLGYELAPTGSIIRLAPPALREELAKPAIQTGDVQLDRLLEEARRRFINPNVGERLIALEKLWDCWERIKSSEDPENKKLSVAKLLEKTSPELKFRAMLEKEARELTEIGNSFHIRHSEVTQQPLSNSSHLDYLFHRLYALVILLLKK